jgi:hypothetical protein
MGVISFVDHNGNGATAKRTTPAGQTPRQGTCAVLVPATEHHIATALEEERLPASLQKSVDAET